MRYLIIFALGLSACAFAQTAFRVDPIPVMTTNGSTPVGAYAPLFSVPGATVKVYTNAGGTIAAVTYTDSTAGTPCPSSAPIVLASTSLCVSTTDALGNFGFWLLPGQYWYTVTLVSGATFGPYPITTSTSNSGSYTPPFTGGVTRSVTSKLAETVSVLDFGGACDSTYASTGTDNAPAVLLAIAAVTNGGRVVFPASACPLTPNAGYAVGALGYLTKNITIDFGGSIIDIIGSGAAWLSIAPALPNGHPTLTNGIWTAGAGMSYADIVVTTTRVSPYGDAQDVVIDNITFQNLTASHAIFWHNADYGTLIQNSRFNSNNVPYTVYYSDWLGSSSVFTYSCKIQNTDFSGVATGWLVGIEGGELSIKDSVMQSATSGAIKKIPDPGGNQAMNLILLNIDNVHFEANHGHNLWFPPTTAPNYFQDNVAIRGSTFTNTYLTEIARLGGNTNMTFEGNFVDSGCFTGDSSNIYGPLTAFGNKILGSAVGCDIRTGYLTATNIYGYIQFAGNTNYGNYGTYQRLEMGIKPLDVFSLDGTPTDPAICFGGFFYGDCLSYFDIRGNLAGKIITGTSLVSTGGVSAATSLSGQSLNIRHDQAGSTVGLIDNRNTAGSAGICLSEDGCNTTYAGVFRNGSTAANPGYLVLSTIPTAGNYLLDPLPVFANNAAAVAAFRPVNSLYKTATGQVMQVY